MDVSAADGCISQVGTNTTPQHRHSTRVYPSRHLSFRGKPRLLCGCRLNPQIPGLAGFCERHFEWGFKELVVERFRTLIWPGIAFCVSRRYILDDGSAKVFTLFSEEQSVSGDDPEWMDDELEAAISAIYRLLDAKGSLHKFRLARVDASLSACFFGSHGKSETKA
ncbi:hypothetical protein ARMGADRAFT_1005396 [Armillaria gallica]|uniref:Uncharacterized protein n=1 Tax=Armillaria gallica TaxID=47427 RepID=A0A2H3EMD6_ARMGA|nr:hypothetical protein ARMGADRAFT_1005396 [Armillaria gallica]